MPDPRLHGLLTPLERLVTHKIQGASPREEKDRDSPRFCVWPPVVHLQRDDDDTPTDGYGGNSSRFIEAYLGMDER